MLKKIARYYSRKAREKRGRILWRAIKLDQMHRVLDLGGGGGEHFHALFPEHRNVVIADVRETDLHRAKAQYGYEIVRLDDHSTTLPFGDGEFDFVFCSSVIEHVTGPKREIAWTKDSVLFEAEARRHQLKFANEIRRISRRYYVQTPYRHFFLESHSWLPGVIVLLPRRLLVSVIKTTNAFWPKKTAPDWRLLTVPEFSELFPDAQIHREFSLGMLKSLMAIKAE